LAARLHVLDRFELLSAPEILRHLGEQRLSFLRVSRRRRRRSRGRRRCRLRVLGARGNRERGEGAGDREADQGLHRSSARDPIRSTMPAVPTRTDTLLARLDRARHRRPGARETEKLLAAAKRVEIGDAERVIRLHELVLFLRAYPHSPRVLRLCEGILRGFAARVARLAAADADLSPVDEPESAGVAGTVVRTDVSYDLTRFLVDRFGPRVRVEWDAADISDRMRAAWPAFVPLLEEEALADANVAYLDWLAAAAGRKLADPAWLLDRYAALP